MPKNRKGSQKPTKLIKCSYNRKLSKGKEAVELYNSAGKTALRWQALLMEHILAVDRKGQWSHINFGFSVPRQNGKNEVAAMRELYGLQQGERILHTAHRTSTSHAAWERLLELVEGAGLSVKSTYRASGKEHIYLTNGGRIEFRTRTSKGGLGESFDLLVIDEAQEYQDDQESTLKYVISASDNPQTLLIGTPPTPISSGTVFTKYRADCLSGASKHCGWAEWSVESKTNPNDKEAWYATNPSLGTGILKERTVASQIGKDTIDFNIQRLGLWIKYNLKSAISATEWEALKCETVPEFKGRLIIAIKYSHDAASVSLAVATRTVDERIYTEVIDCRNTRSGNDWIISFLHKTEKATQKVIVDGQSGQDILASDMKEAKLKAPYLPTVRDVIVANAQFEPNIEKKVIVHSGQPALVQAATNCEHRAIGSKGGYGYAAIKDGVDISLLDSVILACWGIEEFKDSQIKQKVSY